MRWVDVDSGFAVGVYPVVFNPEARKVEGMDAILIGNGQVNRSVGRHGANRCNKMPHVPL
jgi:hypothetical protein